MPLCSEKFLSNTDEDDFWPFYDYFVALITVLFFFVSLVALALILKEEIERLQK